MEDQPTTHEVTPVTATALEPVSGPKAVMPSVSQLRSHQKRDLEIRKVITEYITNSMVEGTDFGAITLKNGAKTKPSLFKPGSEKFCSLFKIRPTFRRDDETIEMLGNKPGILGYICELVDTSGRVVGEGRGTAKVDPNGDDFSINKQVKIAQKRAQIDAVLRTGALSDFFTQDTEDMPAQTASSSQAAPPPASAKQLGFIRTLLKRRGVVSMADASRKVGEYGITVDRIEELDVAEAKKLIDGLLKDAGEPGDPKAEGHPIDDTRLPYKD